MTPLVELEGVSKWYGQVIGLNDVTLRFGPGVTGLLGPNGAGKTTLIRLISGQAAPSIGTVRVLGEPVFDRPRALLSVGCCPDVEAIDEEATGGEFLRRLARLHGWSHGGAKSRARELLDEVGLADAGDRPIGAYSKGMRQRVKLAQALVADPQVLILDEPLNGMDPVARKETIERVRRFGQQGRCVIVSSHILHEVEAMTDAVALIHHGKVLAEGKVHEIRALLKGVPHQITIEVDAADDGDPGAAAASAARALARRLLDADRLQSVTIDGAEVTVETTAPEPLLETVADLVLDGAVAVKRMHARDDSLEAVFDYLVR